MADLITLLAKRCQKKSMQLQSEMKKLQEQLIRKYGREDLYVSDHTDGICVMFENEGDTGLTIGDFIKQSKEPGFDIENIETYL